MSAYIFVSVEIHDPVRYQDYRKTVLPTIEKYGGRFLVRGGKMEVLEGNWPPRRIVIVEFPRRKSPANGGIPPNTPRPKPSAKPLRTPK